MEKIIYEINDKKFALPEKTLYIQYKKFNELLKQINMEKSISEKDSGDKELNVLELIRELLDKDLIPTVLTIILCPVDENGLVKKWSEDFITLYNNDMQYVTDEQLFDIIKNFFMKKTELIQNTMGYLTNLTNTN